MEHPDYHGKIYVNIDDTGLGGGVTDRLKEVKREQNLWRMAIIPINADDDMTFAELSSRKYRMASNGKLEIEPKKDMKKRGLDSPDRADALALSCYLGKIKKHTGSAPGEKISGALARDSYWRK